MATAHDRITLQFSILNGAEVASMGFATAPTIAPTQLKMEALALTASTQFAAHAWAVLKDFYQTTTKFLGADARSYDSSNNLVAAGESRLLVPIAGTSASASLPPSTAIAVSLRTGQAGGRGRGRMYLPAPVVGAIGTDGRLAPTFQQAVLTEMVDFFDIWNADPLTFPVGVASQVGGYVTTVNQLRVGNVYDSQRRRRDALTEAYLSEALA